MHPTFRILSGNFGSLLTVRGIAAIGPLILMPYLVRTVGLSGWGAIALALNAGLLVQPLVQFSHMLTGSSAIAKAQNDRAALMQAWRVRQASAIHLAALALMVGVPLSVLVSSGAEETKLFVGALAMGIANGLLPVWLFLGLSRMRPVVVANLMSRLGFLVLVVLIVKEPAQTAWVTLLGALAATLALLLACAAVSRSLQLPAVPLQAMSETMRHLRAERDMFFIQVAPLLFTSGSVLLLGTLTDNETVAAFAIAIVLVDALILFGRLGSQAALPLISIGKISRTQFLLFGVSLLMIAAAGLRMVATPIVEWLSSGSSEHIVPLVSILAIGIPFTFAQIVSGQFGLALSGHEALARRVVVGWSLAGFLIALAMVPVFDAVGAAIAVTVSRVMVGANMAMADRRFGGHAS